MKNLYNKPELSIAKINEFDVILASGFLNPDPDSGTTDVYEDGFSAYWEL